MKKLKEIELEDNHTSNVDQSDRDFNNSCKVSCRTIYSRNASEINVIAYEADRSASEAEGSVSDFEEDTASVEWSVHSI